METSISPAISSYRIHLCWLHWVHMCSPSAEGNQPGWEVIKGDSDSLFCWVLGHWEGRQQWELGIFFFLKISILGWGCLKFFVCNFKFMCVCCLCSDSSSAFSVWFIRVGTNQLTTGPHVKTNDHWWSQLYLWSSWLICLVFCETPPSHTGKTCNTFVLQRNNANDSFQHVAAELNCLLS